MSKELKVKKYATRVREQHERLSNSNKAAQYQKLLKDLEERLQELAKCLQARRRFEKEHGQDAEFKDYMDQV